MAKKLNRNLVGILTVIGMLLLAVTGFALLANLPGQDPALYAADAERYVEQKEYELATQTYVRAFHRDPMKNPEYLVKAAVSALDNGKIPVARDLLRTALVRNPTLHSALEIATDIEFEIAQKFGSNFQWNRVLTEARKLSDVDENSVLAHHAMGAAYLNLQRENENYRELGEASLKKALELDPTNAKAVNDLVKQWLADAEQARSAGRMAEADELEESRDRLIASTLEKCKVAAPENVPLLKQLQAVFKIVAQNVDEGIAELEKLAEEEVDSTEAHQLLAQIYSGLLGTLVPRDLAKAETLYDKALKIDPQSGEVYLALGRVYKLQQELESDPDRREEIRKQELALYQRGLDRIPRTTHFRKLGNNFARVHFFIELCIGELASAEIALNETDSKEAIARAESWVDKLKQEVDPNSLEVKFLVANLHAARDELVEATKEAEAAERLAGLPGHIGVQVLLSELYARQQQWGAAESALKKAININPDASSLILRLAQVYLNQNKATEVLLLLKPTDLSRRSEIIRNSPVAARLRIDALRQLEQYDQALDESRRTGVSSLDDELRNAQLLIMGEKFAEAETLLNALRERHPESPPIVRVMARLYRDTNRLSEARALVKAALAKAPENRMLKLVDLDLMDEGDPEARKKRTLEIINEETDEFVREISLFDLHFSGDEYDTAKLHVDAAERLQPQNPAVIERQFRLAVVNEDWSKAEKYAQRHGELNIDGTEGALARGRLALARGHFDRAVDLLRTAVQRYPSNALAWTLLADAYQRSNRQADARATLTEALKRDPTNGYANRAMAEFALRDGNDKEALQHLNAAARALPNDAYVRQQLQILKEKENPRQGIAKREENRTKNPKDLQNLILLARLYAMPDVAEFDKAAERYRQALDASGNDLAVAYELADFLGRDDVNRPAEGDALLVDLMTKEDDKTNKARIAAQLGRFYEKQRVLATADRHYRLAVSLDPSIQILTLAGEYYARTNRFKDAIEYYDRAITQQRQNEDKPGAEDSLSRIIALCLAVGDLDRARLEIDNFLDLYPNNPQGMIYEGAYHRMAGDVQQAKRSFDNHLEKNPDNAVALWQRGELFRLMERWQKAIEDLSKAKTYDPKGFNFQHRISLADSLMEVGRHDAAVNELRSILDEHPDETTVAEALVDIYSRIGPSRYPDAETLIYTYMQKAPREHRWPMLLGRLSERAQNSERAIQAYQKAADLSRLSREAVEALFRTCRNANQPKIIIDYAGEKLSSRLLNTMPSALANVAWAYVQTGQTDKALEFYDRALAAASNNFPLYTGVVVEIVNTYGKETALEREQQRAAAEPDNVDRQKLLVYLLQINGKVPEALAVSEKIAQMASSEHHVLFSLLAKGMLNHTLGEYETSRQMYEEALKYDPDNSLALNNLAAMLCEELDRPAEALPYAQRARRAEPGNQDILDTLGWALTLNDRTGEALGVFLRSLELNREHVPTLYHLGRLHQRTREYEEAERRLLDAKKAAEKQGPHPYLSKIEKALQEVRESRR